MKNKNPFSKLTRFWLIPFFSGSFIAFGYMTTSRTFFPKIQNAKFNQKSLQLDKDQNLNKIKKESSKSTFAQQSLKVQASQKTNPELFKKSQETKNGASLKTSPSALALQKEENIFMQLFQSLPEPQL